MSRVANSLKIAISAEGIFFSIISKLKVLQPKYSLAFRFTSFGRENVFLKTRVVRDPATLSASNRADALLVLIGLSNDVKKCAEAEGCFIGEDGTEKKIPHGLFL